MANIKPEALLEQGKLEKWQRTAGLVGKSMYKNGLVAKNSENLAPGQKVTRKSIQAEGEKMTPKK
jgi:hypothetical protein